MGSVEIDRFREGFAGAWRLGEESVAILDTLARTLQLYDSEWV
jgi:hypothetical protein